MIDKFEVTKADQQLTGFCHCYEGFDIISLVESMGLTKEEWDEIKRYYTVNSYMPKEIFEQIEDYFFKEV